MPEPPSAASSLPVGEDMAFQRRNWRAERIAWSIMAALVAAALAGLFGTGPASRASVRDDAGLITVEYDRFLRLGSQTSLRITLAPAAIVSGHATVELDRDFLRTFRLEGADPAPASALAGPPGLRQVFRTEPGAVARFRLNLRAERIGPAGAGIGLTGGPQLRLAVFVYP